MNLIMKLLMFTMLCLILVFGTLGDTKVSLSLKDKLTKDDKDKLLEKFGRDNMTISNIKIKGTEYCYRIEPTGKTRCISNYEEKLKKYELNEDTQQEVNTYNITIDELVEEESLKILKNHIKVKDQEVLQEDYTKSWK